MQATNEQKLVAAALRRLEALEKKKAFDPNSPSSRPTEKQKQVIVDFAAGKYSQYWVRAGNQCQPGDTLVATPAGPARLDSLRPGDTVYSEDGVPIRVLRTYDNGEQEVADLTNRGVRWGTATANHVFQVVTPYGKLEEKRIDSLGRDDRIRRTTVRAPLGSVRNPHAYVLGALLGDGCSRQPGKRIQLSSGGKEVPYKVASILGNTAVKLHESNYTWSVGHADIPHYASWCKGKYAHEKTVDMEVIRSWDRQSLLEFVAGLIDTDGSVSTAGDYVRLCLGMQAEDVVAAFEYACLALWQIPMNRTVDSRTKYKNGPLHICYTHNVHFVREILTELDPHLVSPHKKWKTEYDSISGSRSSSSAVGIRYGFNRRVVHTYDIHVDSPTNLYLLANGLVSHNSGKTQTCAHIVTSIAMETNPLVQKRRHDPDPKRSWGEEPLLILVVGRSGKIIDQSIYPKLRAYLEPGTYKERRQGGALWMLELDNGNRIVFQSMENPTTAQERVMSYVAHVTWVDELPPSLELIREILVRTQARSGYSLWSFTPTKPRPEIQRYVDQLSAPEAGVYRFNMLDNPLYSDPVRRQELLDRYAYLPTSQQRMIFEGDWLVADDQVYYFDYQTMTAARPHSYSYGWRHVASVDPGTITGLTVWAEDPSSGRWYCVLGEYVENILVPSDLVTAVENKLSKYNIVRRIADTSATWYIQQAASMGYSYMSVYKKANRKEELIKQFQEKLGSVIQLIPDTCSDLITEIEECRWSNRAEGKIVNSSVYHLTDSAQYFADNIPRSDVEQVKTFTQQDWYRKLLQANQTRINMEAAAEKKQEMKKQKMTIRRTGRWK